MQCAAAQTRLSESETARAAELATLKQQLADCKFALGAREQSDSGDALILWKAFATDIMNKAGVDMGDLGYLKEEKSLEERTSLASNYKDFERKDLDAIRDTEYSHDIDTEEEKQTRVLKDVERVTGARSVAVTRYGSYESKLVGRNQLGTLKQGDFERIGGHGDYRKEQGVSADGSTVKKVNTQIGSQSHEYNADGTICVDTGGDVNQTLSYNAKKAADATNKAAGQKSLSGQGPTKEQQEVAARMNAEAMRQDAIKMRQNYANAMPNSHQEIGNQLRQVDAITAARKLHASLE